MIFVNKSGNKRLDIIVNRCNELIFHPLFFTKMAKISGFNPDYTSSGLVDGTYIAKRLKEDSSVLDVYTYRSKWPWSAANGYTLQDKFTRIYLNTRKFDRSDASIAATLLHEAVHETDNNDNANFYHHGDNTPKGGCAPEVVADVAYEVLSGLFSTEDSSIK